MAPPPSSLLGAPQSPAPESFSLPTTWTFWALRNRLTESHWILENRAVGKIRYVCVWRHRVGLGFQCASNLELENNCMYHFPEVLIMFLFLLIHWMFLPQPGLLRKVQGMGWYLEEANLAQVSTNILDFEVTPMHMVYEEICRDAKVSSFFKPESESFETESEVNRICVCSTCPGFEPSSGGVPDSRSDSSEGDAGLCGLLHPKRKSLRCGRGAQNPTGGLKWTWSNIQHSSKSNVWLHSSFIILSGYQQIRTRILGAICSKGENHRVRPKIHYIYWK